MDDAQLRKKEADKVTYVCMVGNIILAVCKILAGIFGASAAMIADGLHSFSDLVTDIVLLIGVHMGASPEDDKHPYGHGRFETFATLLIAVVLIAAAFGIFYGGLKTVISVIQGVPLPRPGYIALVIAVISVLSKEWMYRYTVKVGRKIDSAAVVSNAWHHRSDALSSVATLIGISGAIFLGNKWTVLDPITAMLVSVFVFIVGYQICKMAAAELLDSALPKKKVDIIKEICLSVDGVQNPHDIKTRKVGYRISIDLHIDLPKESTFTTVHDKMSDIEEKLKERFGQKTFVSIHPEPIEKQ